MLLTLTTTGTGDAPATDLGYLLHKHPGRMQRFAVPAGSAHVFYPVAGPDECTAALVVEASSSGHVDDGAYAAGSQLAVALSSVFRTAMSGRCPARPDLPTRCSRSSCAYRR